jgi:hypothetical protein
MDTEYLNYTAQNILTIIRSGGPVAWSWGPENFRAMIYEKMPALRFAVSGFIHKGDVVVALNRAADLYEVYCLDSSEKVISSQDGVYFDELISVIDRLVEKDCPEADYEHKTRQWLTENPL